MVDVVCEKFKRLFKIFFDQPSVKLEKSRIGYNSLFNQVKFGFDFNTNLLGISMKMAKI